MLPCFAMTGEVLPLLTLLGACAWGPGPVVVLVQGCFSSSFCFPPPPLPIFSALDAGSLPWQNTESALPAGRGGPACSLRVPLCKQCTPLFICVRPGAIILEGGAATEQPGGSLCNFSCRSEALGNAIRLPWQAVRGSAASPSLCMLLPLIPLF